MALNWFKKKKATTPDQGTQSPAPAEDNRSQGEPAETADATPTDTANDIETAEPEILAETPCDREAAAATQTPQGKGFFARLKKGLSKTRRILTTDIEDLFSDGKQIDDDFLEELEELLITSDMGVQTTMDLMATIERRAAKIKGPDELKATLREEICALLENAAPAVQPAMREKPHVIMVVGVNGVGKTTTIGKLAARAAGQGRSVLISAADTFRAAAIEQLAIWAERAGADLVRHKDNSDPAAVVYDSIEAAQARGTDLVLVDTAGRLHTKVNLMEELKKIKRTISKKIPTAPHEILLVLDATTGQNALSQAKLFNEALDITGLALTKLDGTAKGGIVVSICQSLNIPLQYVGVGESIEDLQPFDPKQFVAAMF
jgi:fused signal recognition particle receptor